MSDRRRGAVALLVAIAAIVGLCLSATAPTVASAGDARPPRGVDVLPDCHAPARSADAAADGCAGIVQASTSGTLPTARRLPLRDATPTPTARRVTNATVVAEIRDSPGSAVTASSDEARAPPTPEH